MSQDNNLMSLRSGIKTRVWTGQRRLTSLFATLLSSFYVIKYYYVFEGCEWTTKLPVERLVRNYNKFIHGLQK